jgi:cytochrome c oxidase cbb3-type subunit 3
MNPEKPAASRPDSAQTPAPLEGPIRHHVFDGIAEYDRRLPNWWLLTFYGAIVFSVLYWFSRETFATETPEQKLEAKLTRIEAAKLAASGDRSDDSLWKMSRNPLFVDAGRVTYLTTCASCHGPELQGGIGANLVDDIWIHGAAPLQVTATVETGVLAKGMPAWGPVLGPRKVNEVVAFILSKHAAPSGAE